MYEYIVFLCFLLSSTYSSVIWSAFSTAHSSLDYCWKNFSKQAIHYPTKWQNWPKSRKPHSAAVKEQYNTKQQSKVKHYTISDIFSSHFGHILTHTLSACLRWFNRLTGSQLRHSHVHPYDNRPLLESSNSDDKLDFHRQPKRCYCGNGIPVNHLQSAFFLCSLLDASRLGPSLWGASKHSEQMKNPVEVLRLMKLCRMWPFGFDVLTAESDWKTWLSCGVEKPYSNLRGCTQNTFFSQL